jgi:hypothetical protein
MSIHRGFTSQSSEELRSDKRYSAFDSRTVGNPEVRTRSNCRHVGLWPVFRPLAEYADRLEWLNERFRRAVVS